MIETFFLLMVGHCLADFPLQGDFLAKAKDHTTELGKEWWMIALPAHAIIHGGMVFFATHSLYCGILEIGNHTIIDYYKCSKRIDIWQDQLLHLSCKFAYMALLSGGIMSYLHLP